jgi:uncharacterized membrane protein YqjE
MMPDDRPGIDPLGALQRLRRAGRALLAQAGLHAQLAHVEWAQERLRLGRMLAVTVAGFACLLCAMLAAGALVLACCWETAYRIPAVAALMAVYGIGAGLAWRRFQALSELGAHSFAATREELAADLALLKSRL